MKRRLLFLFALYFATVALLALQKPAFMAFYAAQAAGCGIGEWWEVVWHGLPLDLTVAGYITALPLLLTLASLWISASERMWRGILKGYLILVSVFVAAIFAVDLGLYEHWGFRLDGTILIYLADPKEAMVNVELWPGIRQMLIFALCAALMIWVYGRIVRLFDAGCVRWKPIWSLVLLGLGWVLFVAIRGGMSASTANVSKVYFSSEMFLNHAATNPVFSFLSTLGQNEDYAAAYPFFDEPTRAAKFERLRGNAPSAGPTERVLNTERPNVVIVLLESFGRTLTDETVDGQPVIPNLQRLKSEGVWFENFFANSFRTDRGEVAVLSGFPAQTRISIMKLPAKAASLPSLARSLGQEGYKTSFTYGGDLNFTNQASYLYATGWQKLTWQRDLRFDTPAADWGYDDALMTAWFTDRVIGQAAQGERFLAGLLTLSSHVPFDVPYARFDDKLLNAMAFTDDCVGRMIDTLKASPAWKNLLVVLVADHGYPYPEGIAYNTPLRHRIPMLWLGGAVEKPREVDAYASQIDICATILAQMNIPHAEFDYSKNIFDTLSPKFAYYTFNEGFGVVDADAEAIWDAAAGAADSPGDPELLDIGRTMLQTTYTDIDRR